MTLFLFERPRRAGKSTDAKAYYSELARIFFHAANRFVAESRNAHRGAIVSAIKTLYESEAEAREWQPPSRAARYDLWTGACALIQILFPDRQFKLYGRRALYLTPRDRVANVLMLLFAYEYVVSDLGGQRAPEDSSENPEADSRT